MLCGYEEMEMDLLMQESALSLGCAATGVVAGSVASGGGRGVHRRRRCRGRRGEQCGAHLAKQAGPGTRDVTDLPCMGSGIGSHSGRFSPGFGLLAMAIDDGSSSNSGRKRALVVLVVLAAVFLEAGLYAARYRTAPALSAPSTAWAAVRHRDGAASFQHPIPKLMAEAEDAFRNKLERQSKTLPAAVAEYKRRYGRDPPKGFDDWWRFTQERNVKMIDDYNAIHDDLSPFWDFSGAELRRRVSQVSTEMPFTTPRAHLIVLKVGRLASIDLVRVENGKVMAMNMKQNEHQDIEISARANGFRRIVEKFRDRVLSKFLSLVTQTLTVYQLPNMDFPINGKAEGRILVPWEHKQYPNLTVQDTSGMHASLFFKSLTLM